MNLKLVIGILVLLLVILPYKAYTLGKEIVYERQYDLLRSGVLMHMKDIVILPEAVMLKGKAVVFPDGEITPLNGRQSECSMCHPTTEIYMKRQKI